MPRIAEVRPAAQPSSVEQRDRYRRMLRAAARLGAENGLDRMQMNDVAKQAGVAIATLYRYFPSKVELMVAVMQSQVEALDVSQLQDLRADGRPPSQRVAELLILAGNRMLERPLLATAMMQANSMAQLQGGQVYNRVNDAFHSVIFAALGLDEPDDEDLRMARIMGQIWYGILVSRINGVITPDQADDDLRVSCTLLLGPGYDSEEAR